MTTIIKLRRDTAANWTSANPILAAGEPGLETDTLAMKFGDGVTEWNDLEYQAVGNAAYADIAGKIANGLTEVNIPDADGNVVINVNDGSAEWIFDDTGRVTIPNDGYFGAINSEILGLSSQNNKPIFLEVMDTGNSAARQWEFDNSGNLTLPYGSKLFAIDPGSVELTAGNGNGSFASLASFNSNSYMWVDNDSAYIGTNWQAGPRIWTFDKQGNLTLPGNTFAVKYANGTQVSLGDDTGNFSFAGNTLSSDEMVIQTNDGDITITSDSDVFIKSSANTYSWSFGNDGNLQLPGNTFAVKYANGTQVSLGGGNATFLGYNYTIGNAEVSGEFVISNTNPANVVTFSINPVDNANVNVENLLNYISNNKDVVTTICDDQARQATYDINSISTVTASYNGYRAVYSKLYDDDPAFCKIGFYQDTSTASVITSTDTDDDEFTVNIDSGTSNLLGLVIIYTENSSFVPSKANLLEYFEYFVDNIITPAAGNITNLRTNFYDEIANTTAIISSWGEDPYDLEFYDDTSSIYKNLVPTTTSGSGIDFTANVVIAGDGTYRVISYAGGSGFNTSETITFDGSTVFGGVTVTNDLVLTITSVSGGAVTGFTVAGTNPAVWPLNNISDGGNDQYDTGNFLKTNQQYIVPYNNGNVSNSGAFGGNDWFVGYAYGQFIFFGDNSGSPVGNFGTHGETGSDGSGTRITGYLNSTLYYTFNVNSVLDYNANLSLSSGSFTLSYDVAGPNLGGVTFNNNTISVSGGGDLILNSPDDITIEPNDDLRLYGGDKQTSSTNGGDVRIHGGQGGPAVDLLNDSAGQGGYVEILGGSGGNDDGNAALGQNGGYVEILGGTGSGNAIGGYVLITGGTGGNGGGHVSIIGGISGSGPSASGNVTIASGPTNWDFKNDGNLTIANSLTIAGFTNTLGSNTSLIQSTDQLPLGILATGGNSAIASVWVEDFANVMSSNIAAIYCNPLPDSRMVRLAAGNNGGSMYFLDFENNGNLKFSGNSVIQSAANNAGDGSGLSTLNLYPDNSTGDDRYLIVDPTGPNHIHIRAGGVQDASNTLLFLGGEQAYVQIDDTVHEVQIGSYDNANATSYYWRFENDGQLTIPGNLVASGASPAPTLSGFSSLSAADQIVVGSNAVVLTTSGDVSATGNVSAVNIGNISSINLDGNVSNLLTGNGTFAAIPTVGNIASINLDGNVSNVLTGNGTFVTLPVINANTVIWSTAPVSNVATGNAGEAAYDSGGNLYICVAANTWSKFTGTTSW